MHRKILKFQTLNGKIKKLTDLFIYSLWLCISLHNVCRYLCFKCNSEKKPHLPSTWFRYFFIFLPYKRTGRERTQRTLPFYSKYHSKLETTL